MQGKNQAAWVLREVFLGTGKCSYARTVPVLYWLQKRNGRGLDLRKNAVIPITPESSV